MRERLQTLPLAELKELAKASGVKRYQSLRKAEIIDLLCQQAEENPQVKACRMVRRTEARPVPAREVKTYEPRREEQTERQESRNYDTRRSNTRTYDKYSQTRNQQGKSYGNAGAVQPAQAPASENGERFQRTEQRNDAVGLSSQDMAELDSGIEANGILEVMPGRLWLYPLREFSSGRK